MQCVFLLCNLYNLFTMCKKSVVCCCFHYEISPICSKECVCIVQSIIRAQFPCSVCAKGSMTEQTEQNEQITVVKRTQEGNLNMFCIPTKSTRRPLLTNLNVGQQLERQSISLDTTLDRIKLSIWLKSISPLNPLPMSLVGSFLIAAQFAGLHTSQIILSCIISRSVVVTLNTRPCKKKSSLK